MSLYLLILACIPCGDIEQGISEHLAEWLDMHVHSIDEHKGFDHHHGDDEDTCSPLCSCDCCSVVTALVQPLVFRLRPYTPYVIRPFAFPKRVYGVEVADIWQPPRAASQVSMA